MSDKLDITYEYRGGFPFVKMRWMVPYALTVEMVATPEMRYLIEHLERHIKTNLGVDLELNKEAENATV